MLNNKLIVTSVILSVMLNGDCFAEDTGSSYYYQPVSPHMGPYSGYNWRPSDSHQQIKSQAGQYGVGVGIRPGGAHSIGRYRPIEERQTQFPQQGAYRFREFSPGEKSGVEQSLPSHSNMNPGGYTGQPVFRQNDKKYTFRSADTKQKYKFRPDQRFPGRQEQGPIYRNNLPQAYPPVYTAPVFRPEDRL